MPIRSRLSLLVVLFTATCCLYAAHLLSSNKLADAQGEAATFACSNGVDDDLDGLIDYPFDDGCVAPFDVTEFADGSVPNYGKVRLSVSDGKSFAQPGETLVYAVKIQNQEVYPRVVTLKLILPSGFNVQDATGNNTRKSETITWNNVSLAPREERTYFVTGTVDRSSARFYSLSAKAYVGSTIATDTTTISRPGEEPGALDVSITDGVRSARPGELLTYTVSVTNGSSVAINGIDLTVTIPSASDFQGADAGGYWTGTNVLWKGLTISAGDTRQFQLAARIRPDTRLGTQLQASASARNARGFDRTDVGSSVTNPNTPNTPYTPTVPGTTGNGMLTKTVSRSEVSPGDKIRYTLHFTNTTNAPLAGVVISDQFSSPYIRAVDTQLSWVLPVLMPGQTWDTSYIAQVAVNAPHGLTIGNTATARCANNCSLATTSRTVTIGVLAHLPQTGVAFDALFILMTSVTTAGGMMLKRKA